MHLLYKVAAAIFLAEVVRYIGTILNIYYRLISAMHLSGDFLIHGHRLSV